MNKSKRPLFIYIGIMAVILLLNAVAWGSTAFCDAYVEYVFPVWVNTYGRITGLAPFSIGEIMLVLGALLLTAALFLWAGYLAAACVRRAGGKERAVRAVADFFCRWIGRFYLIFAWIFLGVCLVMTLNCFILYHTSTLEDTYFGGDGGEEYGLEELIAVRNMVVEECNRLSLAMERTEDGTIVYGGDMKREAIACMQKLGGTYRRLAGFYPRPKPLLMSDFFSQQYMCGYYFPFSLEANYNDVMYIMNKPATMCHELAHLKGYILEDEANFISYLACIGSEDPVFRYSGYLSVLNYLDNDFYRAVGRDREAYGAQPAISRQVMEDNIFVTDEDWDRINRKAIIDTETVDEVSDTFVDMTLKANGVSDGLISYDRVVRLLLAYYGNSSATLD